MFFIPYWVRFRKIQVKTGDVIEFGKDVNAIMLAYTLKLGLPVRKTNVGVPKINKSPLKTFGMVIANFLLQDRLEKA